MLGVHLEVARVRTSKAHGLRRCVRKVEVVFYSTQGVDLTVKPSCTIHSVGGGARAIAMTDGRGGGAESTLGV